MEAMNSRSGRACVCSAGIRRCGAGVLGWIVWIVTMMAGATTLDEALRKAARDEASGDFAAADAVLAEAITLDVPTGAAREPLELARERLRRIRRDFRLTRSQVFESLRDGVRDVTSAEFEGWIRDGLFDVRRIDGEDRFFVSSLSNLFFRRPDLESRRVKPRSTVLAQESYRRNAEEIRDAALASGRSRVLPKRFRIRMALGVQSHSAKAGETVSAWLPVPRRYPHQDAFEMLRSSSPVRGLEAADSPIRSVHLEQKADPDGSAMFEVEYAYTSWGVWFDLNPARNRRVDVASSPELEAYLAESPHVRFTPAMRELAAAISGKETNAVLVARGFHRWIATNIRYSYSPEYSTIPDLAESCRSARRGDCGQMALLFMTLCRAGGIPARWQSGWSIFPGEETIHDWCEIFLEPWGWVPVDPYMAVYAMQYAEALKPAEREALRDFYLGGLTQYRMTANADHNQDLRPTKRWMRSDLVDFQRGEVESPSGNLFFDRFDYDLKWEEIPIKAAAMP